jgi:hypothetical protein
LTDTLQAGDDAAAAVAVAPRVTLESLNARIAGEEYAVFGGVLTICVLTIINGFTVTGESACASPENFNEELGRKFARERAVSKLWGLEGYLLRERLHDRHARLAAALVAGRPDMPAYVGTKTVNARPMTRGDYVRFRGWELPADEDQADAGYLIEYTDKLDGNVAGFAGYITWSPADVFERAYS